MKGLSILTLWRDLHLCLGYEQVVLDSVGVPGIEQVTFTLFSAPSSTHQETNISHLGNRKIIFKSTLVTGYVSSQEGITDTSENSFLDFSRTI